MIKTLQINGYESPGKRFNGISIAPHLMKRGILTRHLIWQIDSNNTNVTSIGGYFSKLINFIVRRVEERLSIQSIIHLHGLQILWSKSFRNADIVHLHIIHSGYFSFAHLPFLTSRKPTIWTIHDPWALTGHCIYPVDCERWKIGCGNCPDLKSQLPLRRDTTKFLFNLKKHFYKKSKFEIVVASDWMRDLIKASPMFNGVRVHKIPFGIDLNFFSPNANPQARNRFNLSKNEIVISFRALNNNIKGFQYIVKALELIQPDKDLCILTLNQSGLLDQFKDRFKVIDLGWQNDDEIIRDVYLSSDIFLMPSVGEAFGMMAIEAMACGKPVIVFEGTALSETCFCPDVGIAVPMKDHISLANAIQLLIDSPEERISRGQRGREIAKIHYDEISYANKITELYKATLGR